MRIDLGVMLARDNLRKHASGPLGGLALVLLCCTVYLPGFFRIPPVDRDESRFAQASRQMFESVALPEAERDPELHSGGLAVPMVGGKPRLNKPPLIYWLQAGSAAVFTGGEPLKDAIWMYRVPSLLAGLVIMLTTWRIGCSMFDPRVGWVGACLLAVSPVFVWEAHQARADMVMVAWTVLAMGQLWGIWKRRGATGRSPVSNGPDAQGVKEDTHWTSSSGTPWSAVLLWVFVALGVMTKGPITPMLVVLAAGWLSVLSRDWRWLGEMRPVLGLVIVAAAVAPWVYAVAQQVGFSNYWRIVSDEVFGRAGSAKEGHWGPPGYHIVLLVVLFWPGSLLTGLSIGRAWRRGHQSRGRKHAEVGARMSDGGRELEVPEQVDAPSASSRSRLRRWGAYLAGLRVTRRPEAFLIAWMVPSWVVFEVVGTKLPHYTMPLYPAVALITARGLMAALGGSLPGVQDLSSRVGFAIWSLVSVALVLGLVAGTPGMLIGYEMYGYGHGPVWRMLSLALAALVFGGMSLRYMWTWRWLRAHAAAIGVSVCLAWWFLAATAPIYFGLTQRLFNAVLRVDPDQSRPVATIGFFEDSMAFLWRARIDWIEPEAAALWIESHPNAIVIAPWEIGEGLALQNVGEEVMGARYAKGSTEFLYLWEAAE